MKKWDYNSNGALEQSEFLTMMQRDPIISKFLFKMGLLSRSELGFGNLPFDQCDSDLEQEIDRKLLPSNEQT